MHVLESVLAEIFITFILCSCDTSLHIERLTHIDENHDDIIFQLPEDLPFEYLLCKAAELYKKHPPDVIELDVEQLIAKEYVLK